MIFDETIFEIQDEADVLNQMIFNSTTYINYRNSSIKMQHHSEVQQLKKDFMKLKERYDEVMRFGRYHPDYMDVMLKTRRAKKDFDMHPVVAENKKLETEVQGLLDEVIVIITNSISPNIKVERGNPFFDHTCSTGCGCSS